jgi:two-component system response regulator YesN
MLKIVIVDDESLARLTIKSMLEELRLPIQVVGEGANGEELLTLIQTLQPDLAFVDIKMPKLNGLEAIKAAKKMKTDCQWIVLTGFSEFEYAREALNLGVSCFLLKPVDPQELLEKMMLIFERANINPNQELMAVDGENICSNAMIKEIQLYLEENYMKEISIVELAEKLHVTPNYLSTLFHKHTGDKFLNYLTGLRMKKAKEILMSSEHSIQDVSEIVGYYSVRHFTKRFKAFHGHYPSECRVKRMAKTSKKIL